MSGLNIMTVYGTRPEAIKMAPLIAGLRDHPDLHQVVAVTGQHREMLDQVNHLFGVTPDYDMDLMRSGATLSQLASRMLTATGDLFTATRPDAVVVQGDTSSAFSAALAAFYQQIPVIHLEAGLRTGDMYSPFPEEANRRLTTTLAKLHLAPTPTSRRNLEREGIDPGHHRRYRETRSSTPCRRLRAWRSSSPTRAWRRPSVQAAGSSWSPATAVNRGARR